MRRRSSKIPQKAVRADTLVWILSLVLLAGSAGCGAGETISAGGTVSFDGQPVEEGTVWFSPVGKGRPASGALGPGGAFRLESDGAPGVRPGEYKVTVVTQVSAATESRAAIDNGPPIPSRYRSSSRTPLTYEVKQGSENQFAIDIPRE